MLSWVYLLATLVNALLVITWVSLGMYSESGFALMCGIITGYGYWRTDV